MPTHVLKKTGKTLLNTLTLGSIAGLTFFVIRLLKASGDRYVNTVSRDVKEISTNIRKIA